MRFNRLVAFRKRTHIPREQCTRTNTHVHPATVHSVRLQPSPMQPVTRCLRQMKCANLRRRLYNFASRQEAKEANSSKDAGGGKSVKVYMTTIVLNTQVTRQRRNIQCTLAHEQLKQLLLGNRGNIKHTHICIAQCTNGRGQLQCECEHVASAHHRLGISCSV